MFFMVEKIACLTGRQAEKMAKKTILQA